MFLFLLSTPTRPESSNVWLRDILSPNKVEPIGKIYGFATVLPVKKINNTRTIYGLSPHGNVFAVAMRTSSLFEANSGNFCNNSNAKATIKNKMSLQSNAS